MKVIKNYSEAVLVGSSNIVNQQFKKSVYDIPSAVIDCVESLLLPGATVVMFSGAWRFALDAFYIESNTFKNHTLALPEKTYFLDSENTALIDKIMHSIKPINIAFLHSGFFCNYQSLNTIIDNMNQYRVYQPKQILLSIPQNRIDFNRLKFSVNDIAMQYQTKLIEDSFILQRVTS